MERFIVSARKYRPDTFETLVGQESIATTLKNSILRNQLAHAYLFCGPRGVGKTSSARIFAKTINCLNPKTDMSPCGICESCISFAEGRSYSIHELDAASNNSVEDIRQLNELVRIPPQIGKYSVYIIDEVHMLSSSAFNAFLKTLEEPPAHAIFILATTEKHKILPTILSRCQTYDFNRISVNDIVRKLTIIAKEEEIEADIEALHVMAMKADGAMRDALTIFDQAVAFCGKKIEYDKVISALNILDYDYYLRLTGHFLKGEYSEALIIFDEILSKGFNALHFIGGLSSHFRDLLICRDKNTIKLLELAPSVKERYQEQAALCSLQFIYDALSITSECETGYKNSGNQRLHVEFSLIKLCLIENGEKILEKQPAANEVIPGCQTGKPAEDPVQPAKKELEPKRAQHDEPADIKDTQSTGAAIPHNGLSTISLKNLKQQVEMKSSEFFVKKESVIGSDEISVEKLIKAWEEMADSVKNSPRFSSTILQTKPVLKDANTILFPVKNELQKKWIEEQKKIQMLSFLKERLNNSRIVLEVELEEAGKDKYTKLYMPEEKAKFLIENYPEIKEMKNDLGLELK